jgi:photosystem II stability/assembly factor-like uncharacterized protein
MSRATGFLATLLVLAPFSAAAEVDPDRLAGLKARLIGPAGMSGRISSIEAVESDPNVVYLGAATGGVWRSRNGGLTWEPLFDEQPVHAVGAIAVFQPNPDILWVGTGEGNPRNSASVGNGVYRSVDAGRTWKNVGLERTERIHRLRLHPTNPDVAYACALGQEWGENVDRGVFRTTDAGRTWSKLLYVDEKTGCADLVMDPKNPEKLFAALWQFRRWPWFFKSGGPGSGLHVSYDGGSTWKRLTEREGLPKGDLGRIGVAIAPGSPEIVYALVEADKNVLLRSEDGGKGWKAVNERADVNPRPFYYADLRVDPERPDRVYRLATQLSVSNDGGKTFETLSGTGRRQIHVDYHAMWIDSRDGRRLYVGNDGGMAESRDRGQTFRFVGNLAFAQFYHVAVDQDLPYNVYGGLQDNNSWRGPSSVWNQGGIRSHRWQQVGTGDGFDARPDPRDSTRGYSLWQGGGLMRWDAKTGERRDLKPAPPPGGRLRFNWNAALALDPFEPDTIYLGSQFVHRSADRGETWTVISPDLTTNNPEWQKQAETGGLTLDVTSAENFTSLVVIAPSPLEKGLLWAASDDGRIHVTRDAGRTWTSVEGGLKGVPASTWIPHLEPSRFDPATAYVVLDNHRRSDWTPYVFKTSDYGKTWTSLGTPDLRGYALVIVQDVALKDLLFLGTEFGLYASTDGGRRWLHLKKAIPTASVMDLAVHPREHDLVVATHGRAIWVLDDIRPFRALTAEALAAPLHLFDVADAQQHWRAAEEGGSGFGAGEFRGTNRPYGALLTWSLNVAGLPAADDKDAAARKDLPEVEVRVADASGKVVRTFKAPARQGLNRAAWDLRRDAFRRPPRPDDDPPDEDQGGPEVPPGAYTVTVKYQSHEASRPVRVTADPRSRNTPEDWTRRWEAIAKAGALNDAAVEWVQKIRRARDDVSLVQQRVRQAAATPAERRQADEKPVVKAGEAVKPGLDRLERQLWQPPEQKGIVGREQVLADATRALGYVQSSWDAPSPTHLDHLRRAEERLEAFRREAEAFFEKDVASFRDQVEAAGLGLLK